ncbi:hypothetical protein LVJ94_37195 [Pendulispora rubella]|uniref:Uncharacterized protein n=1 Tax=Pendulispora rubella TaxID=2741070 RepID=A0ABZ2KVF7_9BACT
MNIALRERYEELQTLLAEATGKDVRARYRIGRLIADVKGSEQRYGARAVKNLAAALGRDEATLYRFALVAEAWTASELETLLARKTPHGEPLSFSHLVELAQMSNKSERTEMLEYALAYGVSVRELIDAIADTGEGRGDSATDVPPSIDSLLRRVASTCNAVQRKIEISERLLSQLDSGATGRTEAKSGLALDELLARAVLSQRAILEASARSIEKLERARRRLTPASPDSVVVLSAAGTKAARSMSAEDWRQTEATKVAAPARRLRSGKKAPALPAAPTPPASQTSLRPPSRSGGRTPRLLAGFVR